MTRSRKILTPVLLLLMSVVSGAGEGREYYILPEFVVRSEVFPSSIVESLGRDLNLQPELNDMRSEESLAGALDDVVGVAMHRRGPNTLEPNVRGFTKDRVPTYLNGVFLPNASPTRTAAPVNFFAPGMLEEVYLVRFIPSVTLGPPATGARLDLRSFGETTGIAPDGWSGTAGVVGDLQRDGFHAHANAYGILDRLGLRLGIHRADLGDYESGDGTRVDADYKAWGGSMAARFNPGKHHSVTATAAYFHQDLVRNTSLPLDTKDSDFHVLTLNHAFYWGEALWRGRLGYAQARPFLTSEERRVVDPALERIEAKSTVRSWTAGGSLLFELSESATVEVGADYTYQWRDATRYRHLSDGRAFQDPIWPGVEYSDAGVFIECVWQADAPWRARLGGRLDYIWSDAGRADVMVMIPGAPGANVRDNYAAYSGPDAADIARADLGGALNFVLERTGEGSCLPYIGLGVTHAPAGVGERYRAFLNALGGGVEVGNPALENETKWEVSGGLMHQGEALKWHVELFYAYFENYIQRQLVGTYLNPATQTEGPLYSFRNIEASFAGFEVSTVYEPEYLNRHGLSLSASAATVYALDRENGGRLPEVPPPLELRGGVLWKHAIGHREVWAELSFLAVASQDNPKPEVDPIFIDTPSYVLWDLRAGLRCESGWTFEIKCENLFDRQYFEYLQPPVAPGAVLPSDGDLAAGDRIPGPGRSISLSATCRF